MTERAIDRAVGRHRKLFNLKHFTPHDLRRTTRKKTSGSSDKLQLLMKVMVDRLKKAAIGNSKYQSAMCRSP
jgi:integrase